MRSKGGGQPRVCGGFFGSSPFGVYDYLNHHGFNPQMTFDVDEFESWADEEDKVFIILYAHSSGAHYVMLQSDENGNYTTYNRLSWDNKAMPNVALSDILRGNRQFLTGFYIPRAEVES
jgi:hypothetical protein